MFIILIVVMISWVINYVEAQQTACFIKLLKMVHGPSASAKNVDSRACHNPLNFVGQAWETAFSKIHVTLMYVFTL